MITMFTNTHCAVLLDDALKDYRERHARRNESTARAKRNDCEHFYEFMIKRVKRAALMSDITDDSIESFVQDRLRCEAPATVARRLATIKHFCRRSAEQYRDFKDPSFEILGPTIPEREPDYFTDDELAKIRLLAPEFGRTTAIRKRNQLLIELLTLTGARQFEVRNVTWGQVSVDCDTLVNVKRKGRVRQDIALHDSLAVLIREYQVFRIEMLGVRNAESPHFPLLLSVCGSNGNDPASYRLSSKQIWCVVRKLGRMAGIRNAHPHRFRHKFADRLARCQPMQTVHDIKALQDALGHRSINTTVNMYLRTSLDDRRKLIGRVS